MLLVGCTQISAAMVHVNLQVAALQRNARAGCVLLSGYFQSCERVCRTSPAMRLTSFSMSLNDTALLSIMLMEFIRLCLDFGFHLCHRKKPIYEQEKTHPEHGRCMAALSLQFSYA